MKTPALRRSLAVVTTAALVTLGSVALATPASAAIFNDVDTEAELISAINDANSNAEADTINLTGTGIALTGDLPDVTSDITFVGPGSGVFTLDGTGVSDAFTLVGDVVTPINVTISGIWITDAPVSIFSNRTNLSLDDVRVDTIGAYVTDGNLSIVDSSFSNIAGNALEFHAFDTQTVSIVDSAFNTSSFHGIAISAEDSSVISFTDVETDLNNGGIDVNLSGDAALTATRTIATDSSDGNPGIEIDLNDTSTAIFTDSTVTGNDGDGFQVDADNETEVTLNTVLVSDNGGDGLDLSADDDGVIVVTDATSTSNEDGVDAYADGSGALIDLLRLNSSDNDETGVFVGLDDGGTVNVTASQIRGNEASGVVASAEGAVGTLNITSTTIDDNGSMGGGGVRVGDMSDYEVTITDSTISNNEAGQGGGIFATLGDNSVFRLVNSTVSGNVAIANGGIVAIPQEGAENTFIEIAHTTITDNTSTADGPPAFVTAPAVISHTIIAGNTAVGPIVDDLELVDSPTINYSLVQEATGAAQTDIAAGTGNVYGFSANLAPLANNGGLTLTHLPLGTSRALEAGNPAVLGAPVNDQRGFDRVIGIIEIGAVEVEAILPATGVEPSKALTGGIVVLGFGMLLLAGVAWRKSRAFL